jgi:putative phage-type endonuclease
MKIEHQLVDDLEQTLTQIRETYDFQDFDRLEKQLAELDAVSTILDTLPSLLPGSTVEESDKSPESEKKGIFEKDVKPILIQELDNLSENFVLDVCDEIKQTLSPVYPDKLLYPELLTQFVYQFFEDKLTGNPYQFHLTKKEKQAEKKRVSYLKTVPQPEQRTPEWYEYRNKRITASDMGCVFGKSPFCSRAQLLRKKVYPEEVENLSESNPFLNHGIKHEDTALHVYEAQEDVHVIEYGCIPHDTIECIGASPDGITDDGIMQEIKCPYSRPIYGPPPIYYWYQIQIQLEVAELNQCDYIETQIKEYPEETFWERVEKEDWTISHEAGIMVEYMDMTSQKLQRIRYPPQAPLDKEVVNDWITSTIEEVISDSNHEYMNTLYWVMEIYSCMPIYRDRRWFTRNLPDIENFWKEVEQGRAEKIQQQRLRSSKKRKPEKPPVLEEPTPVKTVITNKTICYISDSDSDED